MKRIFQAKINLKRLTAVLAVVFSVFGAGASAQTKPLDAKSLAALVEELKGVVARTELDEQKSASVARKWDARRNLSGKTKKQVIDLLYADLKTVITDSGTRYEIYSMFAFYKQIPDKTPPAQKHSTLRRAAEKPASLKKLKKNR